MKKYILLSFFLILSVVNTTAQQNDRIVILSNAVGAVIDKAEKTHYKIFEKINEFYRAVVYVDSNEEYYIRFTLLNKENRIRDTVMHYSKQAIFMLSEKIDHYDDILSGKYKPGNARASIQYVDKSGEAKQLEEILKDTILTQEKLLLVQDTLILSGIKDIPDFYYYPAIGFGVGISMYSPDMKSAYEAMTVLENNHRLEGYAIKTHSEDWFDVPFINTHISIKISKYFSIVANGTFGIKKDLSFNSIAVMGEYYPAISLSENINPFITAGVANSFLSITQHYGERITPVSQTGSYTTFDAVTIESSKTGVLVGAGISYDIRGFSAAISALYLFTSSSQTAVTSLYPSQSYVKSKLSLSSLILGLRMTFYF